MTSPVTPDIDAAQRHIAKARAELLHAQRALAGFVPGPEDEVITDRDPRPIPELPAIAPGQVITDPTFGSRIVRVTGPDLNPDYVVSYRSSDSTIQRAWNATVSRFTVEDTWGQQLVFSFDPGPMRARFLRRIPFDRRRESPQVPPATVVPFNGSDSAWHDTNPDRLYGRSGNKIIKCFDFSTEQMSTVVDLDTLGLNLPEESYTSGVCVMNDTLMTTCGGAVNDDMHWIVIGPLTAPAWRTLDTLSLKQFNNGNGFLLHSTTLDLTGRYLLLVPSQKSGVPGHALFCWDLDTDTITEITVAVSGHCALGRGCYVNQDCEPGTPWDAAQWTFRAFSDPNEVGNCINEVLTPQEIYLAEHPSWTNQQTDDPDNIPQEPFVSATYRHQPSDVPWRAWDEEVITINPASGEVRRQAHHRSQVLHPVTGWDYWATPRPNISPDGRFALFTSNWGRTLGTDAVEGGDRQDAFIVELR
jgi:hypothetical protein